MIQANELRIGNWIKVTDFSKHKDLTPLKLPLSGEMNIVSKVTNITLQTCFVTNGHYGAEFQLEHIDPIPLTPEILGKLPLIGDEPYGPARYILPLYPEAGDFGDCLYFPKLKQVPSERWGDVDVLILEWADDVAIETPAKYLHQLQNLYFALTGSELSVNL